MADEVRRGAERLDDELSRAFGREIGAVSEKLTRRVGDRLAADLKPVTPLPAAWICFAGLIGIPAILAIILIMMTRTAGAGNMSGAQTASVLALFLAGGALFAFLLTRQFAPTLVQPARTPVAVSAFGLLVLMGTIVLFPWREPGTEWTVSWMCLTRVAAFAAVTAVVLAAPLQRTAILSRAAKGAVLGASAGLTGVAIQQFACVHQQAMHLLLWHWSGMAIAAGAGALIGWLRDSISFNQV